MKTTIDRAGRLVVPKAIRDSLDLAAGQELEIIARDGQLIVEAASAPMRIERRDGVLVAVPEHELPSLSAEMVRDTLDQVRR